MTFIKVFTLILVIWNPPNGGEFTSQHVGPFQDLYTCQQRLAVLKRDLTPAYIKGSCVATEQPVYRHE